ETMGLLDDERISDRELRLGHLALGGGGLAGRRTGDRCDLLEAVDVRSCGHVPAAPGLQPAFVLRRFHACACGFLARLCAVAVEPRPSLVDRVERPGDRRASVVWDLRGA